jgi:hypothetical protein
MLRIFINEFINKNSLLVHPPEKVNVESLYDASYYIAKEVEIFKKELLKTEVEAFVPEHLVEQPLNNNSSSFDGRLIVEDCPI